MPQVNDVRLTLRSCRPFDERHDLVPAARRRDEIRMLRVVVAQAILERRQLEEVTLFGNPLDAAAARGTLAVDELCVRHKDFVHRAIPALVGSLVDESTLLHPLPQLLRGAEVARLGGPDEIVVRNIEQRRQVAELLRHPVGKGRRRHAGLSGRALDFLAVLVGTGEEKHVVAHQPVRPRRRVRDHRRVGMAEMGLGVDVVDRGRDVEAAHVCRPPEG
jgi:hypothetical protein